MHKDQLLDYAQETILILLVLLLPLVFSPWFINSIDLPKQLLLILASISLICISWLKFFLTKKISFILTLPIIMLFILVLFSLGSLLIHPGNPIASVLHPFGFITVCSLFIIISALLHTFQDPLRRNRLLFFTLVSSIITGFVSWAWMFGQINTSFTLLPFHPSSNIRTALFVQWIPVFISLSILAKQYKEKVLSIPLVLLTGIASSMALVTFTLFLVRFQSVVIPFSIGWQVALEAMKGKALEGVGPLNYEHMFMQARPATLNVSPIWNIRFLIGPNILFHFLTIYGLLGGLVFIISFVSLIYSSLKDRYGKQLILMGCLISLTLIPPDVVSLFFAFLVITLLSPVLWKKTFKVHIPKPAIGTLVLLPIVSTIAILYLFIPTIQSELVLFKVVALIRAQRQAETIPLLDASRRFTPYRDDVFVLSSQIQLDQTSELLGKKDLTAEEQAQSIQDINTTIDLAQKAIDINPASSTNWKNLADVYSRLRPFVDNADEWMINSLEQSFLRDPTNSFIRAELADLFYSRGNVIRAIQILESAINLKPDFPPFMYALARVYTQIEEYDAAKEALLKTKELLPSTSPDIAIVDKDLESLELLQQQATQSGNVVDTQDQPPESTISPTPSIPFPQPSEVASPSAQTPLPTVALTP